MGALAMVLSGCLTIDEAYQSIEWRSVFLVGGMLPVGVALAKTGAAQLLGNAIIAGTGHLGPITTIAGLFLVTMALNQFIPGGSAVPAVLAPIAIAAAQGLGSDPRAFALVIAVATGTSLLTPFAHPVNVFVMGPGGYTARDYLRLGWPLVVITFVVVLVTVPIFWHV
jgi:di/tricarboxylate transporter